MSTVYITQDGAVVRKTGERLKVTLRRETLLDVPLIKVDQVVLLGNVNVTPWALQSLLEKGIEVTYLSSHGKYIGRFQAEFSKNSILRKAQYAAALDRSKTLKLATSFVAGKLLNMRAILQRAARYDRGEGDKELDPELQGAIERLKKLSKQLSKENRDLDSVRGMEGVGTAIYFGQFNQLLKAKGIEFPGRVRRPPTDPINAMLSFGYMLLYNDLYAACNIVGLDPYAGYLHSDKYGKPSLALDLVEEFRPVMIDSLVLSLINKRMITKGDFDVGIGEVHRLKEGALKTFLRAYEEKKRTEIKHPTFSYRCTYMRCFELQARILAKVLLGEVEEYVPFLIR